MHNGSQNSEVSAQRFCCDVCGKVRHEHHTSPCGLERRGGAGKVVLGWRSRVCWEQKAEPERSWMKCEKQNKINQRKYTDDKRKRRRQAQTFAEAKHQLPERKQKFGNYSFFSGNKRFAETFETARKNKHSTPMVERFIFPEETKVCLKGLFPVTKQTSHNILSNKGFQHMLLEQHSE